MVMALPVASFSSAKSALTYLVFPVYFTATQPSTDSASVSAIRTAPFDTAATTELSEDASLLTRTPFPVIVTRVSTFAFAYAKASTPYTQYSFFT